MAGLGTRVLPGTKTTPKELLNVVDRPILSYIVEEAREAGIEHIVFVTGRAKQAIEDYFDHQIELEAQLLAKGKTEILATMNAELAQAGEMSFTRQMQPKGLGHAVWCARDIIGPEPFAVILPDVIVDSQPGALKQLWPRSTPKSAATSSAWRPCPRPTPTNTASSTPPPTTAAATA